MLISANPLERRTSSNRGSTAGQAHAAQPASVNSGQAVAGDALALTQTSQQRNPYGDAAPGFSEVKVGKWGQANGSVEQILKSQGYSLDEIYRKNSNGKNLLDEVARVNNLREVNLIRQGQSLVVPSKEAPEGAEEMKQPPAEVKQPPAEEAQQPPAEVKQPPAEEAQQPPAEVKQPPAEEAQQPPAEVKQPPAEEAQQPPAEVKQPPAEEAQQPPAEVTQPPVEEAQQPPAEVKQPPVEEAQQPPAEVKQPPAEEATSEKKPAVNEVKVDGWRKGPNDSLGAILQNQGFEERELYRQDANGDSILKKVARANGISNPNNIQAGQTLKVPNSLEALEQMEIPELPPQVRESRRTQTGQSRRPSRGNDDNITANMGMLLNGVKEGKFTRQEFQYLNARSSRYTQMRARFSNGGFSNQELKELGKMESRYGIEFSRLSNSDSVRLPQFPSSTSNRDLRLQVQHYHESGPLYDRYKSGRATSEDALNVMTRQRAQARNQETR